MLDLKKNQTSEFFPHNFQPPQLGNWYGIKYQCFHINLFGQKLLIFFFPSQRDALELCLEKGAESILLDLRHNPGGFFPGGIDVAR